jgi:hypothetical protein
MPTAKVVHLNTSSALAVALGTSQVVIFLLSRFRGSLIEHVRSRSPRKHADQYWQDHEHQNRREQDASHDDQSKRALHLRTDGGG